MTSAIDKIEDLAIKEWYYKNLGYTLFNAFLEKAKEKDYVMDKKSGLFVKPAFSPENQERLGHSSVYIIFPRPVDLHYHEDVDEAFHVIEGTGYFYSQLEKSEREECIFPGREIYVPLGRYHSLMPNIGEYLEIRIECSGILNPKKEICVCKFGEYKPVTEYYEMVNNGNNGLANGHFPKNGKNHNHSR